MIVAFHKRDDHSHTYSKRESIHTRTSKLDVAAVRKNEKRKDDGETETMSRDSRGWGGKIESSVTNQGRSLVFRPCLFPPRNPPWITSVVSSKLTFVVPAMCLALVLFARVCARCSLTRLPFLFVFDRVSLSPILHYFRLAKSMFDCGFSCRNISSMRSM